MSGALYLGGVMTVNLTGCIKWVVLVTSLTTRECSEKNRVFFTSSAMVYLNLTTCSLVVTSEYRAWPIHNCSRLLDDNFLLLLGFA